MSTQDAALDRSRLDHMSPVGLARQLIERLGLLARSELALARGETRAELRRGLRAGAFACSAATAGFLAAGCSVVAVVAALGLIMPIEKAAASVGALFLVLTIAMGLAARSARRAIGAPTRALRGEQTAALREECRSVVVELERRYNSVVRLPHSVGAATIDLARASRRLIQRYPLLTLSVAAYLAAGITLKRQR